MVKQGLTILICVICSLAACGQKISNNKLRFDNQFRPYVEVSVTNDSFSEITSMNFEITYSWKRVGKNFMTKDPRRNTTRNQIVEIVVPEMTTKSISFYIPNVEEYEPYSIRLDKIRYANGKVKQIK